MVPSAIAPSGNITEKPTVDPVPNPLLPPLAGMKEDDDEEVLKPSPFSEQELRIIQAADVMPVDKLTDIILVYERMSNQAMLDALIRVLVRRAPHHPEAVRLKSLIELKEEVRDPGYLDRITARLEAGQRLNESEQEAIVVFSYTLSKDGRGAEAVRLLRLMERIHFPAGAFNPHLPALAAALRASQQFEDARLMIETVATDRRFPEATRLEAQRQIPLVKLDMRILAARQELQRDLDHGIALSEGILRDGATYPPAVDFRVECLTYAGRQREAIAMLEEMRAAWPAPTFMFLPSLGYALFADKQFDASKLAFEQVQTDPSFTLQTRSEAARTLGKIGVASMVNEGLEAMNRRDFATAEEVLAKLEHDFPGDDEVLGYRAALFARTGRSAEALAMLDAAKEKALARRTAFTQQDVLADVFLVRKEFAAARAAYHEILDQPLYDLSMKVVARKGIPTVDKEEIIFRGYQDLSWGRTQRAREKEAQAQALGTPQDKDVQLFDADLLLAEKKPEAALEQFEEIRAKEYPDQPFPGMNGLAASHLRLGEWEQAYESYREAATGEGYLPQEQFEALPQMRQTAALIKPGLGVEGRFLSEAEGQAARLHSNWQTAWSKDWRAIIRAREDWIDLSAVSVLGAQSSSRAEGEVSLQRRFKRGYFGEITAGGSQEGDVIYSARVGRFPNDGIGWAAAWSGNVRSTASLPLEFLNGREDRFDLQLGGRLNPRMNFTLEAYWNQVRLDGDTLGDGYGVSGTFNVILQTETLTRPEIAIGWFGIFTRFRGDPGSSALVHALDNSDRISSDLDGRQLLDALVDPKTHRQGIQFGLRKRTGDDLGFYGSLGGYYELEDSSLNFTGTAGIEWYLSDSALLYAELRYDSSGRGASAAEGVWEANLGGKVTF